jgi:hypothetical protein
MTTHTPTTTQGRPRSSQHRPETQGRPLQRRSSIVPLPTGTTFTAESKDDHPKTSTSSHTPGRPCDPHNHCPTCQLLLAAQVARITGDAPGVLAILTGSPGIAS